MSLALSARHRDMLACMGLPMQGWLVAEATAAPTTAPAQTLVVDTMNPAIRSLRLADLKNSEKITAEFDSDCGVCFDISAITHTTLS